MICEPGRLVLIPFPYADLESSKRRPVLVLTAPDRHGDFIALAVTSVEQKEAAMQLDGEMLSEGRLPKTSWIRLDKIFTLSSSMIVKHLARVTPKAMAQILERVCATIGFYPVEPTGT